MNVGAMTGAFLGGDSGSGGSRGLGKDDFLKLLTTQLTHQDPLEPMKNTEFVAQLAQFSSLEQLMETNRRLELLALAQSSLTSASAVSFLEREVEASGDQIEVSGGVPTWAGAELHGDAGTVDVEIRDENGELVRVLNMGGRSQGSVSLDWDGLDTDGAPVPDGTYTFTVVAKDADGGTVDAESRIRGKVTGVTFEKGYAELELGGRTIGMADVVSMF